MYIIVIGWIYVVLMMSITETSFVAGIMTFVLYGIVPTSIIVYIMGTPARRRRRLAAKSESLVQKSDPEVAHSRSSIDPDD